MNAIAFDTLKYSQTLQQGGVPREHAEAIAQANVEAFKTMVIAQQLAKKDDIAEINQKIDKVDTGLKQEIAAVRQEISDLRTELKLEIADTKHTLIKWFVGAILAQTALIFASIGIAITLWIKFSG